jgi:hypothetical protein
LYSASSVSAIFSCLASSLFSAASIDACLFLLARNLFSLSVFAACSLVLPSFTSASSASTVETSTTLLLHLEQK